MLYPDRQAVTYASVRDRVSPGTVRTKVDDAIQQDACITHAIHKLTLKRRGLRGCVTIAFCGQGGRQSLILHSCESQGTPSP